MTEPSPEERAAIEAWLDTEAGRRFVAVEARLAVLRQQSKDTLDDFVAWVRSPGVEKDASYKLIGEFIVKFSQLEALLRFAIGIESRVQSDMREAFMMMLDFALLVSVLRTYYEKKLHADPVLCKRMMAALSQCLAVNDERVRVAHGMWILDDVRTAQLLHLRRGTLSSKAHYGDVAKIGAIIAGAEKAFDDLLSALRGVLDHESDDGPLPDRG
jgi:hypothetical protein